MGEMLTSHLHQCKTCGIICECKSNVECNPAIFMNYLCLTCKRYWNG